MSVPADVTAEVRQHQTSDPRLLHTDLSAELCACAPVVAAPPAQPGLPGGGVCFACGGMTVRTGTCTTCTECGETGGCG